MTMAPAARFAHKKPKVERDAKTGSYKPEDPLYKVYRPRFLRHLNGAYAALAAGESCSARMAAGGRKPCRSMSQVVL